ncbi:MAG: CBS domain-containing protein [Proteobacteria bacterium]|nr:CBS domain-containing protein [Pseudomonadota bacterium]
METRINGYNAPFFFSQILGKIAFNPDRTPAGRVSDFIVNVGTTYPKVIAICIKNEKEEKEIPLNQIEISSLILDIIILKEFFDDIPKNSIDFSESVLTLKKTVYDRQIVDLNGAKVIRVNDVRLLKSGNEISVTDVDVGYRGILRRLGLEDVIEKIVNVVKLFGLKNVSLYNQMFVSWEYVHPVLPKSQHDAIKLTVPKEQFNNLNPADLADILEELDYEQRESLINQIPDSVAAKVLSETDSKTTQELLVTQKEERAADILEYMAPDKAADILGDMQEEKALGIIKQMEPEDAEAVTELLEYSDNTAGGLMTTEYISFNPNTMVVNAIQELVKAPEEDIETIYETFVVENDKLIGTVNLRQLLISPGHKSLSDIMNKKPTTVTPDENAKKVAELFSKYNLLTLPVVSEGTGNIEGVITVDDVVEYLTRNWQ